MSNDRSGGTSPASSNHGYKASKFLGSLKDALLAASRDDTGHALTVVKASVPPPPFPLRAAADTHEAQKAPFSAADVIPLPPPDAQKPVLSAAEAARQSRTPTDAAKAEKHVEFDGPPTTRVVRPQKQEAPKPDEPAKTELVRGRNIIKRAGFDRDPVVGWLVVVGGLGMGNFRPVYEGNNTIGRSAEQRIPLDFGDDSISSEEQAYIRYDSSERTFLFVPNLAKTNVVSVNNKRPTAALELKAMDVITMGRTQLAFVPFCGAEFDWSEISPSKD